MAVRIVRYKTMTLAIWMHISLFRLQRLLWEAQLHGVCSSGEIARSGFRVRKHWLVLHQMGRTQEQHGSDPS